MYEIPNIQDMTKTELIEFWEQVAAQLEEIQATEKMIREEFAFRLKEAMQHGDIVAGYTVQLVQQTRYKTTVEEARPLGAVKTEEKVDTAVLKNLDKKGVEIPGKTIIEYVKIQPLEKGEK